MAFPLTLVVARVPTPDGVIELGALLSVMPEIAEGAGRSGDMGCGASFCSDARFAFWGGTLVEESVFFCSCFKNRKTCKTNKKRN